MSAVSKKLMPASSAALTTRSVAAASMRIPKLLQPRPTTETRSDPIERWSIPTEYGLWVDLAEECAQQPIELVRFLHHEEVRRARNFVIFDLGEDAGDRLARGQRPRRIHAEH